MPAILKPDRLRTSSVTSQSQGTGIRERLESTPHGTGGNGRGLGCLFFLLAPQWIDRASNQIGGDAGRAPSAEALALHQQLIVGYLHADSALWGRDLLSDNKWGQIDLPKLITDGASLQMFTTVTKPPLGQNYEHHATDAPDNITLLALAQRWPVSARDSLLKRALLQGERVRSAVAAHSNFAFIQSRGDLGALLARRALGQNAVGALPGNEGAHALDDELDNIERLYAAGFRMMGLQHFSTIA